MHKLPKYTNNQKTGNIAPSILEMALSRFAIINPHKESIDLGIDMRGQIIEGELPKDQFFNIQCKGTQGINPKDNSFPYQIKVSTINYWIQQNEVTYLLLVDINNKKCYWCNALKQLEDKIITIQKQSKVTLHIDTNNYIDENTFRLPDDFIKGIELYGAERISRLVKLTEQISSDLNSNRNLNISSNLEIIEILLDGANKIKKSYLQATKILLDNTNRKLDESAEYFHEIDVIALARRYYPEGLINSKAFSSKEYSYKEITEAVRRNIEIFKKDIENTMKLKKIKEGYIDLKDISDNLLGFLYEMTCEDDPYGDHSKLLEKMNEL